MSAGAPEEEGESAEEDDGLVDGRLLDGFLVLAAAGCSLPDDVVTANLTSLQIVDIAEEDLGFFNHLRNVDVSDNQLLYETVLQQLSRLPSVDTLALACNSISSLLVPEHTMQQLQHLDLSYNELHGDVLSQLARLHRLTTLNLASNCISSLPPEEELHGFRALEGLILDANDLVQFVQWRSLDCLPRLRSLSLASNRVKRLKDDAPDTGQPDTNPSYFAALEKLDLSSNEIATSSDLPVLRFFCSLRTLNLSDNPCLKGVAVADRDVRGIKVLSKSSKPFYLKNSGCFQRREKVTQPRLRLDRKKLCKVDSQRKINHQSRARSQVGHLDDKTKELRVSLQGAFTKLPNQRTVSFHSTDRETAIVPLPPSVEVASTHDELSEEELEQMFRERRKRRERKLEIQADEPPSFMRRVPFPEDEETIRKLQAPADLHTADPSTPQPTSSHLFLTTVGDDGGDVSRQSSVSRTLRQPAAAAAAALAYPSVGAHRGTRVGAGTSFDSWQLPREASASSLVVPLPPIAPSKLPHGSATGDGTRRDAAESGSSSRAKVLVPDVSVREAIRALRAASMSEYAVAA
jgi:hypothetical protein